MKSFSSQVSAHSGLVFLIFLRGAASVILSEAKFVMESHEETVSTSCSIFPVLNNHITKGTHLTQFDTTFASTKLMSPF